MVNWRDRVVEMRRVPASELNANPKNWREHPAEQQRAMQGVLEEVGIAGALLARETPDGLELIDGHLRTEMNDATEWPVLILDVDENEADVLLASVDPIGALAKTNTDALKALLGQIETDNADLDSLLADLEKHLPQDITDGETDPDDIPTDDRIEKRCEPGDLWIMGRHRLLCGDTTDPDTLKKMLEGVDDIPLLHADPPYGMGKESEGIANDNLYRENLDAFQMLWWNAWRPYLAGNGSAYIWGNAPDLWRLWYVGGLNDSERLTMRSAIVWSKGSSGAGGISLIGSEGVRQYPPSTERCLFFMLGEQGFNMNADNYWEGWESIRSKLYDDCDAMGWGAADIKRICGVGMYSHWFTRSQWTFIPEEHYKKLQAAAREHDAFKREHDELKREHDELKREFYETRAYFDNTHDNMTDVWHYDRLTGNERFGHATPKPVEMIERAMLSSSKKGQAVAVPFAGTGPEFIASERIGRITYGAEINAHYCDTILARWEAFTGNKAERA